MFNVFLFYWNGCWCDWAIWRTGMNVCYDKKIAVLYFCIEGEPYLWTPPFPRPPPSRRNDCDWPALTTLIKVVLSLLFCFSLFSFCFFLLFRMNHTAMLWTLSRADCRSQLVVVVDTRTSSCRSHPLPCDSRPLSLCSILSAPSGESWRYMFLCKSP